MRWPTPVLALLVGHSSPAFANDTSAELAAGGLVFTRSDVIEMTSEDLFVSDSEVRVHYVFVNRSQQDVALRVAFPMPDIGGPDFFQQDNGVPFPTEAANFLGFRTVVDGRDVKTEVEQKALVAGVDRTGWLTSRAVPIAPHLQEARTRLDALPRVQQDEAVSLGLATVDEYDAGRGWERHVMPAWVLKTTFHWEQVFPAGREIVIDHHYRPAVGGTAGTSIGQSYFMTSPDWKATRDRYCIDDAFLSRVTKATPPDGSPPYTEEWLTYILRTGGNWSGPIGDFRLVVDKGAPENLVSFCGTGVKKIGPTTFEVRRTAWVPDRDLHVLILKHYGR